MLSKTCTHSAELLVLGPKQLTSLTVDPSTPRAGERAGERLGLWALGPIPTHWEVSKFGGIRLDPHRSLVPAGRGCKKAEYSGEAGDWDF